MLKLELFVAAMKAGRFAQRKWITSAFALTKGVVYETIQNEDGLVVVDMKKPIVGSGKGRVVLPRVWDIFSDGLGHYAIIDEKGTVDKITDAPPTDAVYRFKDKITIGPNEAKNMKEETLTTYGNFLFNCITIIRPFGSKLPYVNNLAKIPDIEKQILANFASTPKEGERDPSTFYVDEYLLYTRGIDFLTGLAQLCVQGGTKMTMTPPEGIMEYRTRLIEERKDSIDKLSTIAEINELLLAFDAKRCAGDPGYENFLIDKKTKQLVRQKLFLTYGAEIGLSENTVSAKLIPKALIEGWDTKAFSDMNNAQRAGSYGRGQETQIGGVKVKESQRASSNMNISMADCGRDFAQVTKVTSEELKYLVGFSIVTKEGNTRVKTIDDAGTYLGKTVMVRNPQYCGGEKTDYCQVCVGSRLEVNPNGLSTAVVSYSDAIMAISMSSAHSKQLTMAKMNYLTAIF